MDLDLKKYQILKIKKKFKNNKFFFFFKSVKLKINQWKKNEQELKKLKLKHYKLVNKITLKVFHNSIYQKLTPLVCGVILLITPSFKTSEINYDLIKKYLNKAFNLLAIKLNSKIYSNTQIKRIKSFSYKQNMFHLHKSLTRYLKTSYIIIKK